MNRPSATTYLFGNSVSFIGLSLAVIVSFIGAFGGAMPPLVPVVLLAIGGYSHSAHNRIRKYNAWKSQWDDMNGEAPKPSRRPSDLVFGSFKRNSSLRYVVGFTCWALLAAISTAAGPVPFVMFWLATALLVINAVMRYRRGRETPSSNASVTVCLSVPRQSVSAAQTYAALPAYCQAIIGH